MPPWELLLLLQDPAALPVVCYYCYFRRGTPRALLELCELLPTFMSDDEGVALEDVQEDAVLTLKSRVEAACGAELASALPSQL